MDPMMEPVSMFEPREDFKVVPGDEGHGYRTEEEVVRRTPATESERKQMMFEESLEQELYELELRQSPRQLTHYRRNIKHLEGMSERIYFLRLPTMEERDGYLSSKGYIKANFNRNFRELASRRGDVTLGMDKDQVTNVWGEPFRIDVAGNPRMENERWAYHKEGKTKFIYFEAGRVEGWTTQ
jgi:hypothetical protein